MKPQSTHFAFYMVTHVRKISVLCSDQINPIASRHVRLLLILSMIAKPHHRVLTCLNRRRKQEKQNRRNKFHIYSIDEKSSDIAFFALNHSCHAFRACWKRRSFAPLPAGGAIC